MVKITHGKSQSLAELAERHWRQINPISAQGVYHQRALVSRVMRVHDAHVQAGRYTKAQYYYQLLTNGCELLKKLITCTPEEMPAMIGQMQGLHAQYQLPPVTANTTDFGHELLYQVFQYDNWREGNSSYQMFECLGIEVCPYCNWALVFIDEIRGIIVATFDHFYDKATYPYLSLSFYNLIPACQLCNQTYKHISPFTIDSHLHPYLDSYNKENTFNHNYHEDCLSYAVQIEHAPADIRSEQYNRDLGLIQRYNRPQVRQLAEEHFHLSQLYTPKRKLELVNDWLLVNGNEVEQRICSRHHIPFKEIQILNEQYGKMKRDFAFKSGLISKENPLIGQA